MLAASTPLLVSKLNVNRNNKHIPRRSQSPCDRTQRERHLCAVDQYMLKSISGVLTSNLEDHGARKEGCFGVERERRRMWDVGGRDEGGRPLRFYSCISSEDLIARDLHVRLQSNQAHRDGLPRRGQARLSNRNQPSSASLLRLQLHVSAYAVIRQSLVVSLVPPSCIHHVRPPRQQTSPRTVSPCRNSSIQM